MESETETGEYRILEELEREIGRQTEAVEALTNRARVIEVEVASWRRPARRQSRAGWFVLGFLVVSPVSWFICLHLLGTSR